MNWKAKNAREISAGSATRSTSEVCEDRWAPELTSGHGRLRLSHTLVATVHTGSFRAGVSNGTDFKEESRDVFASGVICYRVITE